MPAVDDSPADLATMLAARLDAVAPRGLRVVAADGQVVVRRGDVVLGGSSAPQILDGSVRQLETAAYATINAIQDVFAEELTTPWPATSGAMPEPGVRFSDGVLHTWFGQTPL